MQAIRADPAAWLAEDGNAELREWILAPISAPDSVDAIGVASKATHQYPGSDVSANRSHEKPARGVWVMLRASLCRWRSGERSYTNWMADKRHRLRRVWWSAFGPSWLMRHPAGRNSSLPWSWMTAALKR